MTFLRDQRLSSRSGSAAPAGVSITARIGKKLASLRYMQGQTLSEVATVVGADERELWLLEIGGRGDPSVVLLDRLASHFGVTVGFLSDPEIDEVHAEIIALHRLCGRLTRQEKGAVRQLLQVLTERQRK